LFHVGNDIVDLTNRRSQKKIDDLRFIDRILGPEERDDFMRSADRSAILWAFWAGKETAYKICRKLDLRAAFSPRLYRVNLHKSYDIIPTGCAFDGKTIYGTVSTTYGAMAIRVMINPEYIHCIGTDETSGLESVVWDVGRMAVAADDADESSFVRQIAIRGLSARFGQGPETIEIKRFKDVKGLGPPVVYLNGEPSAIDISLSHDGPFCAYAFTAP
jgi:hypothetical protein